MCARQLIPFLFLNIFFLTSLYSQDYFEYLGVIKLNDSLLISYKVVFSEADGKIKGYSVTDLAGPHETKSNLSGTYDAQNGKLNFNEHGIVYTKSPITQNDFCYVHFDGSLKKINKRHEIKGQFRGRYGDGKECISGEIRLATLEKISGRAEKLDRKIDRNVLVKKDIREKIDLGKTLDTLNMNIIKKGERLNIFSKASSIELRLFDAGQEDGDRISIQVNGKTILNNYTVKASTKRISIPLTDDTTTVKILALNNGTLGANTVKVDIVTDDNVIETITNMNGGDTAELVFLRSR